VVVPPSVVVPAGQQSINTNFTLLEDVLFDGNTSVTITATANGFSPGVRTFTVYENDVHHIVFGAVGTNQTSGVPFRVSFTVRDVNDAVMHLFRGNILLGAVRDGTALPMSPTSVSTSNSISRGSWSGNITVNGWGTNVQLVATAPSGMTGLSNPFDIPAPAWVTGFRITGIDLLGPDVRLSFNSVTGRTYQVEVSTNLGSSAWYPIGEPLNGTGDELSVTNPVGLAELNRFYRLSVTP
jgi:hypothetical protein